MATLTALPPELTGTHRRTYQALFQYTSSQGIPWHEVHALFRILGKVVVLPEGGLKVTRNGLSLILPPPITENVFEPGEFLRIRDFLERSELAGADNTSGRGRWLASINHHETRIFHSDASGTVSEIIRPNQQEDSISHVHGFDGFSRGQEKPAEHSYFGPIAAALKDAGQILLAGSGTGSANEMMTFVAWLRNHNKAMARRIIGIETIDSNHITDNELLAKARDFSVSPSFKKGPASLARNSDTRKVKHRPNAYSAPQN